MTKCNAALSASSDGLIYKANKIKPCYSRLISSLGTKIVIPNHRYAFVKFVTKKHRLPAMSSTK